MRNDNDELRHQLYDMIDHKNDRIAELHQALLDTKYELSLSILEIPYADAHHEMDRRRQRCLKIINEALYPSKSKGVD